MTVSLLPTVPLIVRAFLALLLLLAGPALADDLADDAPEPPLPAAPAAMPLAPSSPVVLGPDARELLVEQCKEQGVTDCFRNWRPPPPPPEPEKPGKESKEAKAAPPPPPGPNAPREPAAGGPLVGPPPVQNPDADRAQYEALVRAMKEAGLDGKVVLPNPPQDGSTTMELAPPKGGPAKLEPKKAPSKQ